MKKLVYLRDFRSCADSDTHLQFIKFSKIITTSNFFKELMTLRTDSNISHNIMKSFNWFSLSSELINLLQITLIICHVKLLANLLSILFNKKGLCAEIDNMIKALKLTLFLLLVRHFQIESSKNSINADVIESCIICHKIFNLSADLVVSNYLKQHLCHVFTWVLFFQLTKTQNSCMLLIIFINKMSNNIKNHKIVWWCLKIKWYWDIAVSFLHILFQLLLSQFKCIFYSLMKCLHCFQKQLSQWRKQIK